MQHVLDLNPAALLADGGGLPALLTSGTAIVVYIFLILSVIAVLVLVVLLSGRERPAPKSAAGSAAVDDTSRCFPHE